MIHDPIRLQEVIDEIVDWTIEKRRAYIASIEKAFGPAASEQIKQGLTALWQERKA